ncbi:hypothetical protein [Halioxenophilus sp. WMMB6]|uniref:hypothetical protein n=1 Tax=Halioxenophilus sp. WMMB6 TaxID=3073815 RepID=UPI00295EF092|nr:hypothetical protein [Halioxenophilus sp. WMMB6]
MATQTKKVPLKRQTISLGGWDLSSDGITASRLKPEQQDRRAMNAMITNMPRAMGKFTGNDRSKYFNQLGDLLHSAGDKWSQNGDHLPKS